MDNAAAVEGSKLAGEKKAPAPKIHPSFHRVHRVCSNFQHCFFPDCPCLTLPSDLFLLSAPAYECLILCLTLCQLNVVFLICCVTPGSLPRTLTLLCWGIDTQYTYSFSLLLLCVLGSSSRCLNKNLHTIMIITDAT